MPLGEYADFDACMADQLGKGHDDESARKICGAIKARVEDGIRETRLDFGVLGKAERTPSGGVRVPANLTRVGVFTYHRADGSKSRELRPSDEVFKVDSLASLAGAPVTDLHPDQGAVIPANWKALAIGHVGDAVKQDGAFVVAKLAIQDQGAIDAVERGDRRELSCGYTCRTDATPGEFEGEHYDSIQRDIRYNHVAIGPAGWGRAGRDVALRLDGGVQISVGTEPAKRETMKYRIDGVDYDTGSAEFVQALQQRDTRNDAAIAKLTAERDAANGRADAAEKRAADLDAKAKAAEDPARLDALVDARVKLHTAARAVLGAEAKLDGKTDREIMIDVVRHDDAQFDPAGKSDEYVRGRFEAIAALSARADAGGNGIAAVRDAATQAVRRDAADKTEGADAARRRMIEEQNKAATQPLRYARS